MLHPSLEFIGIKYREKYIVERMFHVAPLAVFLILIYKHVCNNKYVGSIIYAKSVCVMLLCNATACVYCKFPLFDELLCSV
jgi:hypothetical protein